MYGGNRGRLEGNPWRLEWYQGDLQSDHNKRENVS